MSMLRNPQLVRSLVRPKVVERQHLMKYRQECVVRIRKQRLTVVMVSAPVHLATTPMSINFGLR